MVLVSITGELLSIIMSHWYMLLSSLVLNWDILYVSMHADELAKYLKQNPVPSISRKRTPPLDHTNCTMDETHSDTIAVHSNVSG